ncbi:hypothetical protein SCA6_015447 [Theobroma cacao]
MVRPMSTRKNTCSSGSFKLSGRKHDSRTAETCLFPWKIVREKESWHQELQQHRHTRVRQESPILRATLSTLPLSNARFSGLEENGSEDKSKCQEHFDVYKECKKKEREARLERNKSRSFFS